MKSANRWSLAIFLILALATTGAFAATDVAYQGTNHQQIPVTAATPLPVYGGTAPGSSTFMVSTVGPTGYATDPVKISVVGTPTVLVEPGVGTIKTHEVGTPTVMIGNDLGPTSKSTDPAYTLDARGAASSPTTFPSVLLSVTNATTLQAMASFTVPCALVLQANFEFYWGGPTDTGAQLQSRGQWVAAHTPITIIPDSNLFNAGFVSGPDNAASFTLMMVPTKVTP